MSNIAIDRLNAFAYNRTDESSAAFSIQGVGLKLMLMMFIMFASALISWDLTTQGYAEAFSTLKNGKYPTEIDIPDKVNWMLPVALLVWFPISIYTIFNPMHARYTAPIYAVAQGFSMGIISAAFEAKFPGIVMQCLLTLSVIAFALGLITFSNIVQVTDGFYVFLSITTLSILTLYFSDAILRFFGTNISFLHDNSSVGFWFQFAVVCIASLYLVRDFAEVMEMENKNACKELEWFAAFGILITFVWIYLELLKLMARIRYKD